VLFGMTNTFVSMKRGGGAALAELLHGMHHSILCGCYSQAIATLLQQGRHLAHALHACVVSCNDMQQQERFWQHASQPFTQHSWFSWGPWPFFFFRWRSPLVTNATIMLALLCQLDSYALLLKSLWAKAAALTLANTTASRLGRKGP
jgi:hypothetical protein